jgi:hypothetical protein
MDGADDRAFLGQVAGNGAGIQTAGGGELG